MRILVVSLLRIGDSFMHLKVIQGIQKKYPHAKIDIAMNDEFAYLNSFFEEKGIQMHLFPRKEFQKMIFDEGSHLLEPIWAMQEWFHNLSKNNFDQVYNFTHTRISAYFMEMVYARKKSGLCFEGGEFHLHGTEWLDYLNQNFASGYKSEFHIIEVLSKSFDLPLDIEKSEDREFKKILMQPLTSDSKKNWPLGQWKKLFELIRKKLPQYEVRVLAAPSELPILRDYFQDTDVLGLTFSEAEAILKESDLLISGDTSIVHLASLTRTRSVMISLGSSDPIKTGPFLFGSGVISGEAPCRPCSHTTNCSQPSHICSSRIDPESVFAYTLKYINGGTHHGKRSKGTSESTIAKAREGLSANS